RVRYMVGDLVFAASARSLPRCAGEENGGPPSTMSASAFCFAIDLNAASKSSDDLTIVGRTMTPKPLTVSWIALTWDGWVGLSDMRTAMSLAFGTTACRNSTPLGIRSASKLVTPVTLPPGRARLSTRPEPTGSAVGDQHNTEGAR